MDAEEVFRPVAPQHAKPSVEHVEALLAAANRALDEGEVDRATTTYCKAQRRALELGAQVLADRAYCGLAYIEIERGQTETAIPALRRLLQSSAAPIVGYLASYHLARAFDQRRDFRKSSFYAHLAVDYATHSGRDDLRAAAYNQLGNCLLARSQIADALPVFQQAAALARDAPAHWRVAIADGVGYCLFMTGHRRAALRLLYANLRLATKMRSRFACELRRTLCHALLELGRPRLALRHGEIALREARALGNVDAERVALLLLAQATAEAGRAAQSTALFAELQARHFPKTPGIAEFFTHLAPARCMNLKG